jgi:hypothetical protein
LALQVLEDVRASISWKVGLWCKKSGSVAKIIFVYFEAIIISFKCDFNLNLITKITLLWRFSMFCKMLWFFATEPSKVIIEIANMNEVKHKIIRLMGKNCEKYYIWREICGMSALKMVHKDTSYSLKVREENFCNTTLFWAYANTMMN